MEYVAAGEMIGSSRRSSVAASIVSVPTPSRDLSFRRGAYTKNITRLEQSAEEMSAGGSDIGEEIRRLNEAEKQQRSRQNSIQSSHHDGDPSSTRSAPLDILTKSRTNSYANSIVDLNNAARAGGLSPGGFVTSPVGSLQSGSWSRTSIHRQDSRTSRLADMMESSFEDRQLNLDFDSYDSRRSSNGESQESSRRSSKVESQESFSKRHSLLETLDVDTASRRQSLTTSSEIDTSRSLANIDTSATSSRRQSTINLLHISAPSSQWQDTTNQPDISASSSRRQSTTNLLDVSTTSSKRQSTTNLLDVSATSSRRQSVGGSSVRLNLDTFDHATSPNLQSHVSEQADYFATERAPDDFLEDPPLDLTLDYLSPNASRRISQANHARDEKRQSRISEGQSTMLAPNSAVFSEEGHTRSLSPPLRPSSTDTFQQAQTAFEDFDGVHCSPEVEEFVQLDSDGNEIRRMSGRASSGTSARVPSMLLAPSQILLGAPPPDSGMVFYPAPVPRMLNLPKRLSQLPAANIQSRRQTRVVSQMPQAVGTAWPENRQSRTPEQRGQINERMSVANYANVPPQLRASVFFEHQTVVHDVDVKSESAVATLDSILKASATAPVSAFTDHPYAGDISKTVYAQERQNRKSTAIDLRMSTAPTLANRKSNLSGLLKRASSSNALETSDTARPEPRRVSTMPLPGDIQEEDEEDDDDDDEVRKTELRLNGELLDEDRPEFLDDADLEDIDFENDPTFAQPTTLLAELQVRKAQLKSRNRTAATAFPNGMHSTLLELDAVAAIDKKKRSNQRVALAWEDPSLRQTDAANEAEDDDVPLGMLYPSKNGLLARKFGDKSDWDRPLGLMEKRQIEDNEPLSARRSRLRGEPVSRPIPTYTRQFSEEVAGREGQIIDDDTMNQRLKRMSTNLDGAIADVAPKDGSRPLSTFADEVIGHLNLGEAQGDAPVDVENETLGQRRARLQREKEARPALQARNSMSNLLATNPVGQRRPSREHVTPRGTLLFASEQAQAEHKRNMLASNMRSSSYGLLPKQNMSNQPYNAGYQSTTTLAGPMYHNGMQSSASTPVFGLPGSGYFAQPTMPMAYGNVMQPAAINPFAYGMLTGQAQMYPGYAGMQHPAMVYPQAMPYGVQPTIQQRSAIDQWRSNIAQ